MATAHLYNITSKATTGGKGPSIRLLVVVLTRLETGFCKRLGRRVVDLHAARPTRANRGRVDLLEVIFLFLVFTYHIITKKIKNEEYISVMSMHAHTLSIPF